MVNTMGPYPLFCYVYSPAVPVRRERSRRRGAPQAEMGDGGFSLALYSDGTLVHFQYDVTKTMLLQQNVFEMPIELTYQFMRLLENETWWIRTLPLNIRAAHARPAYSCLFGFAGHPMCSCDELHRMAQLPESDPCGTYARRLEVMRDFVAQMLGAYGLELYREKLTWAWENLRIWPVTPEYAAAKVAQLRMEQQPVQLEAAQ